jgi:hypothetical protein
MSANGCGTQAGNMSVGEEIANSGAPRARLIAPSLVPATPFLIVNAAHALAGVAIVGAIRLRRDRSSRLYVPRVDALYHADARATGRSDVFRMI